MELEHRFTVAAPVEQAWQVLLDLERVAPCMPGASLTSYEGDEFTGNVRVKIGPVTMTFAGSGRFAERDEQARRIVIEASGKDKRGGGTARATVRASLQPAGEQTDVQVHTDLVITGRAAQFGRGMIGDVSNRLLGQFTDCLSGKLAGDQQPGQATGEPVAAPAANPGAADNPATLGAASAGRPAPAGTSTAASSPATAAVAAEPEPIDLLAVTGVRAAAGRLLPYAAVFLAGGVLGSVVTWLLLR